LSEQIVLVTGGGRALTLQADVTDREAVAAMLAAARKQFGARRRTSPTRCCSSHHPGHGRSPARTWWSTAAWSRIEGSTVACARPESASGQRLRGFTVARRGGH
jgi:hypothetical protein